MGGENFPYLDVLLGVILVYSCYKGWTSGFIKEALSLIGLILACYGCIHFSSQAAEIIYSYFALPEEYTRPIGMIAAFTFIIIVINILGSILGKIVNMLALGLINRVFGVLFSLTKVSFIIGVFVWQFDQINRNFGIISNENLHKSVLYTTFLEFSNEILPEFNTVKDVLQSQVDKSYGMIPSLIVRDHTAGISYDFKICGKEGY